jgi:tetratricopeptide (TPR) repeat protein
MINTEKRDKEQRLAIVIKLLNQKKFSHALNECNELVVNFPEYIQGWELLSQSQLAMKQTKEAVSSINQLLVLDPTNFNAKLKKIKYLQACSNFDEAKNYAKKLSQTVPENIEQCGILAACLSSLKLYHEALALYENLVNTGHLNASLFYNIGTIQRFLGKISDAEKALNTAIELNPLDYEAIALRTDIMTQTLNSNHVVELKSLLAQGIKEPKNSVKINYALAKELEDLGQYQRSFRYLKTGADIRRSHMQYSPENELKNIKRVIETFSQSWLAQTEKGTSHQAPIFIIGLPRTGTTLVERILESHSKISSAGELNNFAIKLVELTKQYTSQNGNSSLDLVGKSQYINFDTLGLEYTESIKNMVPKNVMLIDKMPLNFLYAGLIHKALPQAKIIHLRRHPIDSCYAIYKKLFKNTYPFSYNLNELAKYYVAYRELMAHWHRVMPNVIYDIDYENVVEDVKTETEKLLAFCGLEWEEDCLRFYENKSASTTASAAQVRQPIYNHSIAKWRHYEKELTPLIETLKAANITFF